MKTDTKYKLNAPGGSPATADAIRTDKEFRHRMDDELSQPLNGIVCLAYDTEISEKINNEIDRIVKILEREKIINPRRVAPAGPSPEPINENPVAQGIDK
jgi:hypothetical protein